MPIINLQEHGFKSFLFPDRSLTFLILIWCIPASFLFAQRPQYDISVSLDTFTHVLSGTIDITYTNRTTRILDSLGVHLYPNAHADNNSALVRQMLHHGETRLYHAPQSARGDITGFLWTSETKQLIFKYDINHRDIGWIVMQQPLLPGQTIRITTPFNVRIPESFSRIGRTGDAYQLTQWYPHLAVFDEQGWHTMPYLNYGEYFNDFADYKVSLQVPSGYTVAATGKLVTTKENVSITEWNWEAENVIDFAWFASPHFQVIHKEVVLGTGKVIQLEVYTDTIYKRYWDQVTLYAERALLFYSDWLGPYAYDHMRVVSTPLSAAGFMEYPMVAQISYTPDSVFLDQTVAHEIGHTWLYGVLANDERTFPWLDEGLNTFIERKYTEKYYPGYKEIAVGQGLSSTHSMPQPDVWQHIQRFNHQLEPPDAKPESQAPDQYAFSAYTLPAQGLELLQVQVGTDMIKKMFRIYYEDHKFTHVTPEDMKSSFESICDCDLSWFFEDWIKESNHVDYRIKRFDRKKGEVTLVNRGASGIPVSVSTYAKGNVLEQKWIDGFAGERKFKLEENVDEIRLFDNAGGINKSWNRMVKPKTIWPVLTLLPRLSSYERNMIHVSPFIGNNLSDGLMPGIVLSSGLMPQHHFKWIAAPLYGLESKEIRGYAEGRYTDDFVKGPFDKLLLSVSVNYFGYNKDTAYDFHDRYLRLSPSIGLRVAPDKKRAHRTQWWKYRYVYAIQKYATGIDAGGSIFEVDDRSYGVHELSYTLQSDFVLQPYTAIANVQAGSGFVKVNLHYKQHIRGKDKRRGIWIQGFAGWLPHYDNPVANVKFDFSGSASDDFFSKDYMYDFWLGGRNATTGLYSRQLFPKDAGLKTLTIIGVSEKWMIGGGFSMSFPFPYIHFYMDGAVYRGGISNETELSYSGGLSLVVLKDVFEIYVPILESQDIINSITYIQRDRWFERVCFQANIKLGNPMDLLDSWQLRY